MIKRKRKISVLQLGQVPPPIGGITKHVQGLKYRLDKDGIDNNVVKFHSASFLIKALNYKIIHSHEFGVIPKIILPFLRLAGKRVVLGVHGDGLEDQLTRNYIVKLNFAVKILLKFSLRFYDAFIVCNIKIKDFLITQGVSAEEIFVISTYIPSEEEKDGNYVDDHPDIYEFMRGRKYFVASGDLRTYLNEYLYGFDLIIEFARTHKYLENEVCFVLNVLGTNPPEAVEFFDALISKYQLKDFIYLNYSPIIPINSLVKDAFALLRFTNTDGSPLSILEALYLKVPVIASDAVPRPASCILVKNRDLDDISEKILNILENRNDAVSKIYELFDSYERIKFVYESLL